MRPVLLVLGLSFSISLVHTFVHEINLGSNTDEPNLSTLEDASSLDSFNEGNQLLSQEDSSLNDAAVSEVRAGVDATCLQADHQPVRKLRAREKSRVCIPRKPRPGFRKPSSYPTHKTSPGPQRTTQDRHLFPMQENEQICPVDLYGHLRNLAMCDSGIPSHREPNVLTGDTDLQNSRPCTF